MSGSRKQSHSPHSIASFTSQRVSLGKTGMGRLFTASCSACDWSIEGVDPDAVRDFARRHVETWEAQWKGLPRYA